MATIFRQPGFNRLDLPPRTESALAATDQGRLDNLLQGKDAFFSGPGAGPDYDYPNPRGKPFPSELRTWAVSVAVALFASALPPVQQHAPPNPLGKPFPSDQRGYVQSSPVQLIGQDQFFGAAGEVPAFDYPNPRGRPHPSDLRTFANPTPLNLLGQDAFFAGAGVGPDYDYPNPGLGKPYPVALRTWTQSPSLFGRDQFFGAPGQGPAYDYPNPTLRKSSASAFAFAPNNNLPLATVVVVPATTVFDFPNPRGAAFPVDLRSHGRSASPGLLASAAPVVSVFDYPNPRGRPFAQELRTWTESTVLPLITVVVPPATMTFDYPNPRGAAFPQDLRTHVAPLAVNLTGKDRFFGAAGQPPVYDFPNPASRRPQPAPWSPNNNLVFTATIALPATMAFDFPNPHGPQARTQGWVGNVSLTTVLLAPATTTFDYPNPRGRAYASELRTWLASSAFIPAPVVTATGLLALSTASGDLVLRQTA